jgi:hypothetical protein
MFESYKVRRKFQWNGFVYAPPGQCECSTDPGSNVVSKRTGSNKSSVTGRFDGNTCYQNTTVCKGRTATDCKCSDNGYCGMNGGFGACGIAPYMYGGNIWLAREGDPRKEHILSRRFVTYDPTLPNGDDLVAEEKYKVLAFGEPSPDKILFPPDGEVIVGRVETPTHNEMEALALETVQSS